MVAAAVALVLAGATVVTAFIAEILVGSLETFSEKAGLSEFFVAAVIVAIVGNAAEHGGAVVVAARGKIMLAAEIALASSAQVAVFLIPAVALLSWLIDPLALTFREVEIVVLAVSVVVAADSSRRAARAACAARSSSRLRRRGNRVLHRGRPVNGRLAVLPRGGFAYGGGVTEAATATEQPTTTSRSSRRSTSPAATARARPPWTHSGASTSGSSGPARRHHGPVRLRQVDAHAHHGRPRPADQRRCRHLRHARVRSQRRAAHAPAARGTSASSSSSSTCSRC